MSGLASCSGRFVCPFDATKTRSRANSVVRYLTNAGGGWGDPLTRDPAKVLIDVRDGYVSVAGAARDYGVVVLGEPDDDPEEISVDDAATARTRAPARRTSPTQ